jgi:3-phosphoshikimate 1-carboxyvinyltransferase
MSDRILIHPVDRPIRGTIRPPGSKSLTNRALITAALASGRSHLTGVLDSQDTRVMVESLRRLGIDLSHNPVTQTIEIKGCAGRPTVKKADLWLENSGTSIRFLTAVCCLGTGEFRLDGNSRMRERPIADLTDALNELNIAIRCERDNGCPPVVIQASGIRGGRVRIGGEISSQFLSALLMACPCASSPISFEVAGPLVSEPYVEMTIRVCEAFGVKIERPGPGVYHVIPQAYQNRDYGIEPDASAASYFLAAAAVTGGEVTIPGLTRNALQGDVGFADVLGKMGCQVVYGPDSTTVRGGRLNGIDVDMNAISDTAQTLAAIAPFASGLTRIRNVAHIRHKETDRVAALANELRRIGQIVEEFPDGLAITPAPVRPATIATYDDHRMAMSFAITGLVSPGITIANPECTAKTYPNFFDDLAKLAESR